MRWLVVAALLSAAAACPPREPLLGSWSGLTLERRVRNSPLVFHGLAVETYPPIGQLPPPRGFSYSAQFWLISVYKGAPQLSNFFGTGGPLNGVYDIRDRRVNVTGFYRPNATSTPRCWTPVTSQKYYVIFADLKGDELQAKDDDVMGSTADWTEQNEARVWRGVGWDEWSDWSACSSSCGDGVQQRWRYCLLQAGCQGYNKQSRKCNTFPCRGVVAPLSLEEKKYFHPSQWERVPGRETAWRLKPNSYLWLPAAELPFPNNYFKNHFALLLSLRIDPKKPAGGTLFSLRSRRQEECYFAVEVAGPDAVKLVHSGPNGTQSVLVPAQLADGKWHRLALGIQDDSSVRSYFDCRWVSTDILRKNSLEIPEDADLVIGYLFSGELEDMVLVSDPAGVAQQCSTNLTPALDPLLEAARPHRKQHRPSSSLSHWYPMDETTANPRSEQLFQDDEDFEGSGSTELQQKPEWSDWSDCSVTCGLGTQHRNSLCADENCIERKETRPCNARPCNRRASSQNDCRCENGGRCRKRGGCHCKGGWHGTHCEEPVCNALCHQRGGTCTAPGVCVCPTGLCQDPICDPECKNGGHCLRNNQCQCPPNTSGDHCQNYTCGAGCQNGGTCVGPGLCECPHNSTGLLCEVPLCEPPCENSATCAPGNICLCHPHSSGPRCHDK
nr:protein kinase C-binding protein NELL1-like isoform X2 [Halyomorpha halys]